MYEQADIRFDSNDKFQIKTMFDLSTMTKPNTLKNAHQINKQWHGKWEKEWKKKFPEKFRPQIGS